MNCVQFLVRRWHFGRDCFWSHFPFSTSQAAHHTLQSFACLCFCSSFSRSLFLQVSSKSNQEKYCLWQISAGLTYSAQFWRKTLPGKKPWFGIFCTDTVIVKISTVGMAEAESFQACNPISTLLLRICFYLLESSAPSNSFGRIQFIHQRRVESSPVDTATSLSLIVSRHRPYITEYHLKWTHTLSSEGLSLLMAGYKLTGKQCLALIISHYQGENSCCHGYSLPPHSAVLLFLLCAVSLASHVDILGLLHRKSKEPMLKNCLSGP